MEEPLGIQWIQNQRILCLDVIYSQNMNGADFKGIITKRYNQALSPLIEPYSLNWTSRHGGNNTRWGIDVFEGIPSHL